MGWEKEARDYWQYKISKKKSNQYGPSKRAYQIAAAAADRWSMRNTIFAQHNTPLYQTIRHWLTFQISSFESPTDGHQVCLPMVTPKGLVSAWWPIESMPDSENGVSWSVRTLGLF